MVLGIILLVLMFIMIGRISLASDYQINIYWHTVRKIFDDFQNPNNQLYLDIINQNNYTQMVLMFWRSFHSFYPHDFLDEIGMQ
jgi:hypothetical protein